MTDEKTPQVIWLPEAEEQIKNDPELAKALPGITEVLKNAMQGVADGRYKSFDDAVEAMLGSRPEKIAPPNPPKHGYFLSTKRDPQGDGMLAVITDGHPKMGHTDIVVMDVNRVPNEAAAREWFKEMCDELPWREK